MPGPGDDDDDESAIDYSTWETNDLRDKSQIDPAALEELNERGGPGNHDDDNDDDDYAWDYQ